MQRPSVLVPSQAPPPLEEEAVVRRRRGVVAATLVVGAALLGGTLGAPRGSAAFYGFGLAVATTWVGGSVLSGPLHLGRKGGVATGHREVAAPLAVGAALFLVFLVGRVVGAHLPLVGPALESVLAKADAGPVAAVLGLAVLNGIAEEVFFRGALFSALGGARAPVWSTVAYALVTVATLNVALVVAAGVLGAVVAVEREATRGVLAPIVTHVAWSVLVILLLPR